ncbi:Protein T08G2.2 [Aphelenchoides avenae]|nr:Protein T08G2.2 [Aphelenchus avenae]
MFEPISTASMATSSSRSTAPRPSTWRTPTGCWCDADAGVVNPNHCIEEWTSDRVGVIFYVRFFNWEIARGNYQVRNREFARSFLRKWADWQYIQRSNWNGADNGVTHLLQTLLRQVKACDTIRYSGTNHDAWMALCDVPAGSIPAKFAFSGEATDGYGMAF